MPKQNNKTVRLKLVTIAPDPVQYKPYNPVLTGCGDLYIDVPVEDGSFEMRADGMQYILDIDAFKCLLINLDNMIDEADKTRQNAKLSTLQRRNSR